MSTYSNEFYAERNTATRHAAEVILSNALTHLPPVTSAADYGCGVGTWLKVLQDRGIQNIRGFEGAWLDRTKLVIPQEKFTPVDFAQSMPKPVGCDLTISLEVAEHIPADKAPQFVELLASGGGAVLFSAAIPGQGGIGHVNEQWPDYWAKLFARHGLYPHDVIRSKIWTDAKIPWWYRQNVVLYTRDPSPLPGEPPLLSLVHPECLRIHAELYVGKAVNRLGVALKTAVQRRLGIV